MNTQVNYLTLDEILTLHENLIQEYGGADGVREFALLESAIFRPQSTFANQELYLSVFDKAAALMHSLILNHPFIDGNKRTGSAAAIIFLYANGYELDVPEKEVVNKALQIASKKNTIDEIAKWLKENS